jgi:hypothetical protein
MSEYLCPLPNSELRGALRPFVCPPAAIPEIAAQGAPEILPGLIMAIAVHIGARVDFLPRESIEALGGGNAVRVVAIENLRALEPPEVETIQGTEDRTDSTVSILRFRDPFGASRICDLDRLIATTFGIVPTHGILLAVPTWHVVLLHVPQGAGVLTALPLMAQLAYGAMDMAAKERRLSCDVFFVAPDRRIQRVARGAEGKGVTFETRGFIAEVLFGPRGLVTREVSVPPDSEHDGAVITTLLDKDRTVVLGVMYGIPRGMFYIVYGSDTTGIYEDVLRQWIATLRPGTKLIREEMVLGCRAADARQFIRAMVEGMRRAGTRVIEFPFPDDSSLSRGPAN